MKVFITENSAENLTQLQNTLRQLGHTVHGVTTGAEALQQLSEARHTFRVLLIERHLMDADGLEIVRLIRQRERNSPPDHQLYILMFSEADLPNEQKAAHEVGADDFLAKPYEPSELVSRLEIARRLLEKNGVNLTEATGGRRDILEGGKELGNSMLNTLPSGSSGLLGEVLVEMGLITRDQLQYALIQGQETGQRLGYILVSNGWMTDEDITRARAIQLEVPYIDVAKADPAPQLLARFPYEQARKFSVLPIAIEPGIGKEEVIKTAVLNPWNIDALDAIQHRFGKRAAPYLANERTLAATIERLYRPIEAERQQKLVNETLEASIEGGGDDSLMPISLDEVGEQGVDEAPVIRLVNSLLAEAVRQRASDIHVEPYKGDVDIRYRVDGDLVVIRTLPRRWMASMSSRIKVMASLDISERRIPQDGRIALRIDGRDVDFRVSTLPTQYGERIVLRILDRANAQFSLNDLGFSALNRTRFEELIHRPWGIILVTGPTGSGKTTTLYAALNALRSPEVNILTCEDPIEYELDRVGQSNINVRAGLTFAAQLRAILRQDPDVVLVGEIRDQETAEIAFRAALTGHLVLSTLHCNEAAGAPTRLIDMGVPPYLIASALIGAVAQRLVRRVCPHCRQPYTPTSEQRLIMQQMIEQTVAPDVLFKGAGCELCGNRGMKGRMGVHEIMMCDEKVQHAIMKDADTAKVRAASLAGGMIPMLGDGMAKAIQGQTTFEEVQRRLFAEGMGE
jgi:type IV pilus assembly protein PilB